MEFRIHELSKKWGKRLVTRGLELFLLFGVHIIEKGKVLTRFTISLLRKLRLDG